MGNYVNLGNYKVKYQNKEKEVLNKPYYILKAYEGFKLGFLLLISSKEELYKINSQEMNEKIEYLKSIHNSIKNMIKLDNISYLKKEEKVTVFFEFKERKNYQTIEKYIDGIEPYYFSCLDIKEIMSFLNKMLIMIKEKKLPIPFLSPKDCFIDKNYKKINFNYDKEIKYLYIYPYLEYFSDQGFNFYKKILSILPNKVKNYFPKSKYLNWNIGLFIYLILFRDTPNYQLKVKSVLNKEKLYYSIDIKDHKIPDKDENLFDLLHFLLDIEVTEIIKENILDENIENELFKQYLSHSFFNNNNIINTFEIVTDIKPKKYYLKEINENQISDLIEEEEQKKNLFSNVIKDCTLLFNNKSLFVVYNVLKQIKVYNYDLELLYDYKKTISIPSSINNIVFKFDNGILFYNHSENSDFYYYYIFKKDSLILNKLNFPVIGNDNETKNGTRKYKFDYQEYFVTSSNKLLVRKIRKNDYYYDREINISILIYDLDNLISGKNNYIINLIGIINFELFSNSKRIVENIKKKELICVFSDFLHFYESETYKLKFKLYLGNYNYDIRKLNSEMFLINQSNTFYILKNHQILFTIFSKKNNLVFKSGILINDKFLLCIVNNSYYGFSKKFQKYGKVINDESNKENYCDRIIFLEINDNDYIKHHLDYFNCNSNSKSIPEYFNFKDNIIRSKDKKGYKYFILEEEKK